MITIDFSIVIGYLLLVVLLFCSALISGAEVALFSLTPSDINEGKEQNSKPIEIVSCLLEKPKKLLATILVANNFINIAIVILFAYLGNFLFDMIWSKNVRIGMVANVILDKITNKLDYKIIPVFIGDDYTPIIYDNLKFDRRMQKYSNQIKLFDNDENEYSKKTITNL